MKSIEERVNGYGPYLRLVTPALCTIMTVILALLYFTVGRVENKVYSMDAHFTNHLMHHQDLEVGYAGRLAKIEGINHAVPKWLVDRVLANTSGLERTKRLLREMETGKK